MSDWKLFLDDERFPVDTDMVIIRNVEEAKEYIVKHGMPSFISFDNDLGENKQEGRDLMNWIIEQDLNGIITIPKTFTFYVHSQNPIARDYINNKLTSYINFKFHS